MRTYLSRVVCVSVCVRASPYVCVKCVSVHVCVERCFPLSVPLLL